MNQKIGSGQALVKRHAELYVAEIGQTTKRLPSSFELLSLNPLDHISDWSTWIRNRCMEFVAWLERKDARLMMVDFSRRAWIGYLEKGSSGPVQVTLSDSDGATIQLLLNEISEKLRLVFVLPIQILK